MPVMHIGLKIETCTLLLFPQSTMRRAPASYITTTTGTRRNRTWATFSQTPQSWMGSCKIWPMYATCSLYFLCTMIRTHSLVCLMLTKLQGKEVESSTEESDRSSTPHQSNQQRNKAKGKAPVVPPMWGPGFPPVPPPGSHLRMVSKWIWSMFYMHLNNETVCCFGIMYPNV